MTITSWRTQIHRNNNDTNTLVIHESSTTSLKDVWCLNKNEQVTFTGIIVRWPVIKNLFNDISNTVQTLANDYWHTIIRLRESNYFHCTNLIILAYLLLLSANVSNDLLSGRWKNQNNTELSGGEFVHDRLSKASCMKCVECFGANFLIEIKIFSVVCVWCRLRSELWKLFIKNNVILFTHIFSWKIIITYIGDPLGISKPTAIKN